MENKHLRHITYRDIYPKNDDKPMYQYVLMMSAGMCVVALLVAVIKYLYLNF